MLGRTSRRFCDVGCCCCFSSLEVFTFLGYFSLPPALHPSFSDLDYELYTGYFRLIYYLPGFSVTVLPRALTVLSGHFLPTGVFLPHAPSLTFLARFVTQMRGWNTPSRILLCACPHRVVSSGWRMDLNYSYCSYKAIDLSTVLASHVV